MANGSDRVYVSLDTLRTEIRAANGELELALRDYITAELDKKAPLEVVLAMSSQVSELSRSAVVRDGPLMATLAKFASEWEDFARGELEPAMRGAIETVVVETVGRGRERRWTRWERILAVVAIALWLLTTVIALAGLFVK